MILMYEDPVTPAEAILLIDELKVEANEVIFATKKFGNKFMKRRDRINTLIQRFCTNCTLNAKLEADQAIEDEWTKAAKLGVTLGSSLKSAREVVTSLTEYIS